MFSPVLLLFGAGPNTGIATARKFASNGYKVAAVTRNPTEDMKAVASLIISANLSDPSTIAGVFEKCTAELGTPHVVVYNGYHPSKLTNPPEPAYTSMFTNTHNPLNIPVDAFAKCMAINTTSAYAAATQAVAGFATLPVSASRTFLYTGNMQNTQLYPATHVLGAGKNATAYFLEMAAAAYRGRYRFYYVDERTEAGESTMMDIDGEAHGETFWELAGAGEQREWDWTFVKGKGYRKVAGQVNRELRDLSFPGIEEAVGLDELVAMMKK